MLFGKCNYGRDKDGGVSRGQVVVKPGGFWFWWSGRERREWWCLTMGLTLVNIKGLDVGLG